MNKKKKIIIWVIIAILLLVIITSLALFFLISHAKNNDIVKTEEVYERIAGEVSEFSFDKTTGMFYVNNEIVVISEDDVTLADMETLAEDYDAELSDAMEEVGIYCLRFEVDMSVKEIEGIIKILEEESEVSEAYLNPVVASESDTVYEIEELPEKRSPEYPEDDWKGASWNMEAPQGANWGVEAINAPLAWAYMDELEQTKVGLIDSLVSTEHIDLDITAYVTSSEDSGRYIVKELEVSSESADLHGCHVAGTIGANWDNGIGVSGVMGTKGKMYYSCAGRLTAEYNGVVTGYYSAYDYVKAIKTLVDRDVRAINISQNTGRLVGFAASKGNENAKNYLKSQATVAGRMLEKIVEDIEHNGGNDFVLCISAGNSNNTTYYRDSSSAYGYSEYYSVGKEAVKGGSLAEYNNFLALIDNEDVKNRIIVVGSVKIDENSSSSSEIRYEYSDFACVGSRVDVVAPGEDICSLDVSGIIELSGTSMAAPHVTGTAGLAFAANPSLSGPDVKAMVTNLVNGRYYYQDGYSGMVDAGLVTRYAIATRKGEAPPISNYGSSGLDLCFLVDTTGSMEDDIQNAKNNMVDILAKLSEKSSDYRVAVVDYRDFAERTSNSNDYPAKVQLDFSGDDEKVKQAINGLTLGNGGDDKETVFSGLNTTLGLKWRPGAQKIIIILGDAPPHDPEPVTGFTYDGVLEALYSAEIGIDAENSDERVLGEPENSEMNVYTIGIENNYGDFFEKLAKDTGGAHTKVESAEEVSDAIIESIEKIEVKTTEFRADFGRDLSGEKIDLYKSGKYEFSFKLDKSGSFSLANMEPESYEWRAERIGKRGTLSIKDGEELASVNEGSGEWYSFALIIWHRHRIALIASVLGLIVLIILLIAIVKAVKKRAKKVKTITKVCCRVCKNELAPGQKFCMKCGTPVDAVSGSPDKAAFCKNCGAKVEVETAFCKECGTPVQIQKNK